MKRILEVTSDVRKTCYYPQEIVDGYWHNVLDDRKGCRELRHAMNILGRGDIRHYVTKLDGGNGRVTPKVLIIGNGASGGDYRARKSFKEWDAVFVFNEGWKFYVEHAERDRNFYWMCMEIENYKLPYFRDVPPCYKRVVNLLLKLPTFEIWHPDAEMLWFDRSCNDPFLPREYGKGLQHSPETYGTVILNAMHLASMWQAQSIEMVGCELAFDNHLHYFSENEVEAQEKAEQARLFGEAKKYIVSLLPIFKEHGVDVIWNKK